MEAGVTARPCPRGWSTGQTPGPPRRRRSLAHAPGIAPPRPPVLPRPCNAPAPSARPPTPRTPFHGSAGGGKAPSGPGLDGPGWIDVHDLRVHQLDWPRESSRAHARYKPRRRGRAEVLFASSRSGRLRGRRRSAGTSRGGPPCRREAWPPDSDPHRRWRRPGPRVHADAPPRPPCRRRRSTA
jgi:hypothetical protein